MPQVSQRFGPYPVSVVLDGSGNGEVTFQATGSNVPITNVFVKVSTAVAQAVATGYKNFVSDGSALGNTQSGSTGAPAVGPLDLLDGERLIIRWTGGDAGATATATFTGVEIPFNMVGSSQLTWDQFVVAGDGSLVFPAIKSPNYVAGVSGWIIRRDGTFELAGGVFRGEIWIVSPSGSFIHGFADASFAEFDFQPPPSAGITWGPARVLAESTASTAKLVFDGPPVVAPAAVQNGFIAIETSNATGRTTVTLGALRIEIGDFVAGSLTTIFSENVVIWGAIQWGLTASVPVEASDTSITNGTTTSTTFVNTLTTSGNRGVAFVAPPSGDVMVSYSAGGSNTAATQFALCSFEVRAGGTVGSGTIAQASDDNTSSQFQSTAANAPGNLSQTRLVTGLTPGDTYNTSITYRTTNAANAATFNRRTIMVHPAL